MVRKHQGIIQTGKNKGKLNKGYYYTGDKTKSGLPVIKKSTPKKYNLNGGYSPSPLPIIGDFEILTTRLYMEKPDLNNLTGLAKYIDCIIFKNNIIYKKNLDDIKTIFLVYRHCHISILINKCIELLNKINNKVNIVIGGDDNTFPRQLDKRYSINNTDIYNQNINFIKNQKINKLYVSNLDQYIDDKCIPIPLGVTYTKHNSISNKYHDYINLENKDLNRPMKFTYFNRIRNGPQWLERQQVFNLCNTHWKNNFISYKVDHFHGKEFLIEFKKYPFTVCVHGGGFDLCPKLFEAIIVGVIPIIKKTIPMTDAYQGLPVVIIDEWNENTITSDKLNEWYNLYNKYFTDDVLRKKVLEIISLKYWVDKISTI